MPTAMITGPTSGIGYATARSLAGLGYHIIAAARSEEKAGALISEIEATGGTCDWLPLELDSLNSAKDAAWQFESSGRPLDVLVNNAAAGGRRGLTRDGFELQFGVNHLGHFNLTHHLRRTFGRRARIINVTSSMYESAPGIPWDRLRKPSRSLFALKEYAVSKLANILFTREFATQQPDWRTYAVHPGWTDTPIVPAYARPFLRKSMHSADEAAKTIVWCATDKALGETTGGYFSRMKQLEVNEVAADDALGQELRKKSEIWCDVAPQH